LAEISYQTDCFKSKHPRTQIIEFHHQVRGVLLHIDLKRIEKVAATTPNVYFRLHHRTKFYIPHASLDTVLIFFSEI